jgi:hypothetical protein
VRPIYELKGLLPVMLVQTAIQQGDMQRSILQRPLSKTKRHLAEALTLYTSPGAAMKLQGFQEQHVLILRPFLPLLGYCVRLARLIVMSQRGE